MLERRRSTSDAFAAAADYSQARDAVPPTDEEIIHLLRRLGLIDPRRVDTLSHAQAAEPIVQQAAEAVSEPQLKDAPFLQMTYRHLQAELGPRAAKPEEK